MLHLSDDGTMDTVLYCDECGREIRYSAEGIERDEDGDIPEAELERAQAEHADECDPEPDEDAITTEDHRKFYQYGKLVLQLPEDADHVAELRAFMDREQFWPDAWWISDHGNAHRIDLSKEAK